MSDTNLPDKDDSSGGRFPGLSFTEMQELTELILKECYAENLLDEPEFERRLSVMHAARSVADLEALVEDLPVRMPEKRKESPLLHHRRNQNISLFLGEKKVYGDRLNCRYSDVLMFMGEMTLDFREVDLPPGTTTIKLTCVMGELRIIVPPELIVESDIAQVMATVKEGRFLKTRREEGRPVLKILGFILMAEVHIKVKELFEK